MARGRTRRLTARTLIATALVVALALFAGCKRDSASGIAQVEIRDYQGEKLGSVDDFHDNSIHGTPAIDPATYRLAVDGLVSQSASYTLDELASLPHAQKVVELICVEGWRVKALWEGIPIAQFLARVQPLSSANTVIFHAADGYTTSLPLATVVDRDLIVADKINGITLPPDRGFPLQLVAEDKLGYKWAKWIVRIELSSDSSYLGTWETQGYSNDAEVGGPRQDEGNRPTSAPAGTR